MDTADSLVYSNCCYSPNGDGDPGCGHESFKSWTSAEISELIAALDAELQRREHAKNV